MSWSTRRARPAIGSHDLPYEDIDATGATANHPYRRLIEQVRTLYRQRRSQLALLPLGQLESAGAAR